MALELYHLQSCPYCRKVREYIEEHGLRPAVQYHEISQEGGARQRVMELTGDGKVPVLVVDGHAIAGSHTILDWLAAYRTEPTAGRQRDAAPPANDS